VPLIWITLLLQNFFPALATKRKEKGKGVRKKKRKL
jgi:hypothetical protein